MADRTWNGIDMRILDENWERVTILVMQQLIIKCPNQYGIYKLPLGFLKRFFDGIIAEGQPTIEESIAELEKDGAIKLYDDIVWIVKKWGREVKNPSWQNQVGAIEWVSENFNGVLEDFKGAYHIPDTPSKPLASSDTDSDSDADSEISKKEHKTVKSEPDLPVWCVDLVWELFPNAKDEMKQALALEQLSRLDSYSQDDITAVLRWAKADTGDGSGDWPGWSAQFQSCCQLRTKRDGVTKFAKMKGGYDNRKSKRPEIIFG